MKVRDLMLPVSEYMTVRQNDTLGEVAAVIADSTHRDVIVTNEAGDLVGVITMTDILASLEPNYKRLGKKNLGSETLSHRYVADLFKDFALWSDPLAELCRRGATIKAGEAMYVPAKDEYLNEGDDLSLALHHFIAGAHQPVVVKNNGTITGIIRLGDVFEEIKNRMIACQGE